MTTSCPGRGGQRAGGPRGQSRQGEVRSLRRRDTGAVAVGGHARCGVGLRRAHRGAASAPGATRGAGPSAHPGCSRRACQAERSYRRLVRDWQATAPAKKVGASATPGRASQRSSKDKAARQTP